MQTTEDLRFFAEKVKYFNAVKKVAREYLERLRQDAKSALLTTDSISSLLQPCTRC